MFREFRPQEPLLLFHVSSHSAFRKGQKIWFSELKLAPLWSWSPISGMTPEQQVLNTPKVNTPSGKHGP